MNKTHKIAVLFFCIALACAPATGCGAPKPADPPVSEEQEPGEPDAQDSEGIGQKNPMTALHGYEMPLEGNPVAGDYITTSGVNMGVGEDGSYSWDETEVGGVLVTGQYIIYEGTIAEQEDGTTEYVTASDTGPLYTLYIEFDSNGNDNVAPFTIQVFDTFDEDTFLVTDLVYGIEFEAIDALVAAQDRDEWYMVQLENLVVEEGDGPSIVAAWDELPGAEGYMIAILPLSLDEFEQAVYQNEDIPDPVYQGGTEETTITVAEGLARGGTYTVCVVGVKDGETSLGAYQDITLE